MTGPLVIPSSETQGQSVESGEEAGRNLKFSSTGERAPGYRLSSNYFQKFKRMPAPDEKNLGETVRRLGTIIRSIFCAQSGAGIRLNFWK